MFLSVFLTTTLRGFHLCFLILYFSHCFRLVISVEPLNQEVEGVEVEEAVRCEVVAEDLAVIGTSHTDVQTQQAAYILQKSITSWLFSTN